MNNGEVLSADPNRLWQATRKLIAGLAVATSVIWASSCDPASTEHPQTPTTEVAPAHEATPAEQLTEATLQLRFTHSSVNKIGVNVGSPKSQDSMDYQSSEPNCTAAYIGKGWFATAAHCFDASLHVGGGYYDQVYDAKPDLNGTFDIWQGTDPSNMDRVGGVDSVVIDGNIEVNDVALVHVDENLIPANVPALEVTDQPVIDAFTKDEKYFIAGYPQTNGFEKIGFPLQYIGLTSGEAFGDVYGLGDNLSPMPLFGVKKGTTLRNPEDDCRPGMSGSVVVDGSGKAMGVLSRLSLPGDTLWQSTLQTSGEDLSAYDALCLFQPINTTTIEAYQEQLGVPASGQMLVSK